MNLKPQSSADYADYTEDDKDYLAFFLYLLLERPKLEVQARCQ